MTIGGLIRWLFSPRMLLSRGMLHALFWVNFLGTIYGYVWYWDQMVQTLAEKPIWMIVFVPDSPTGSLFFTLTVLFLLLDSMTDRGRDDGSILRKRDKPSLLRSIIEALAAVTSFKYGVWAVMIIVAGAAQGDNIVWEDWMLGTSHLGMALEALLFLRFYTISRIAFAVAALWTFANDTVDYTFGVYPNLPLPLWDDVPVIGFLTFVLTALSVVLCVSIYRRYKRV